MLDGASPYGKVGMWGGNGVGQLLGGPGYDEMYGEEGDDIMFGDDGIDTMYGGVGDDILRGGNGFDTLHGNDGNDWLYGGLDSDELFGDDNNDILCENQYSDVLVQGSNTAANNSFNGGNGTDVVNIYHSYTPTPGQTSNPPFSGDGFLETCLGDATYVDCSSLSGSPTPDGPGDPNMAACQYLLNFGL